MEKDFSLTFGLTNYRTAEEMITLKDNITSYQMSHHSIGKVHFEKLVTKWGDCYKISTNLIKLKAPLRAFLNVNFHERVSDEDIPSVEITVVSEENSYGITMYDYQDGKRVIFNKVKGFLWTGFQPTKVKKMKSLGNCSPKGFYDCFHENLLEQNYNHCPRKCYSVTTYENATPICETVEDFQCSHQITQSVKENSTCLPACNQIDFNMDYEYQEGLEDPNAKRNVTFAYKISNPKMKVEEEYLVHDFVGMLGSIGGTLGSLDFLFLEFYHSLLIIYKSLWTTVTQRKLIQKL